MLVIWGTTMSQIYENARAVMDEVKHAVTGKDDCIQKAFAAILAEVIS